MVINNKIIFILSFIIIISFALKPALSEYNLLNEKLKNIDITNINIPLDYDFSLESSECKEFQCRGLDIDILKCNDEYYYEVIIKSIYPEPDNLINKDKIWVIHKNNMGFQTLNNIINCLIEQFGVKDDTILKEELIVKDDPIIKPIPCICGFNVDCDSDGNIMNDDDDEEEEEEEKDSIQLKFI